MEVLGRRRRGRPKRRQLAGVRDDIREKGLSLGERYDHGTWRRIYRHNRPHIKVRLRRCELLISN